MRIAASQALLAEGLLPATITVADGRIAAIEDGVGSADVVIDHGYLSPGLIDLQLNGAFGVDFATATEAEWDTVTSLLPSTGVTAFLPTVITNPVNSLVEQIKQAPHSVSEQHAQPLGFHVEGPFISRQHRGVHREDFITDPQPSHIQALIDTKRVRLITMAPELSGAMEAIKKLADAGIIVSVGHSSATSEVTHEAADAGARMVTHLFNGMTGMHHREPGVAAAALADPRFTCGLIADLVHVHGDAIKVAFAAAEDRIALVTDALVGLGLPPGTFSFGGKDITIGTDFVARDSKGILAGSVVRMDHAIGNCMDLGIEPTSALRAASTTPARVLGDHARGVIAVGARADLTWLAPTGGQLTTQATWINGTQVYAA